MVAMLHLEDLLPLNANQSVKTSSTDLSINAGHILLVIQGMVIIHCGG